MLMLFFSICRCIGDHRGDKQKFYPADCVRLLTRHEIDYIIALVSQSSSCGIDTSRIGSLKPLYGSTASIITATMLAVFCWDMQVWAGGRITWVGSYIEFHKEHKEMTFLLVAFTFCSTSLQFLMYTHHFSSTER